jgi:hypothetical protein
MNWNLLTPILIGAAVTIAGWIAVSALNARRDKKNKTRELRTQYLINVCRTFTRIGLEKDYTPFAKQLEDAVADIYLFGSSDQIRLVKEYAAEMDRTNGGNLDRLLHSLRNELRKELYLEALKENPQLLRIAVFKKPNQAPEATLGPAATVREASPSSEDQRSVPQR